jgi:D-alanyl-D-alanine carboxypeptidase/D-alanyl-D-alanine-endopeptidase (penicillin-binding protein 4)
MRDGLDRRAFLAGLGALAGTQAAAAPPAASLRPLARRAGLGPAPPGAEALIAEARLRGTVALGLADVATGRMLETVRPGAALPPASTAKAITALYALDALGPAHRFETRVLAAGELRDGVLKGDLILAGGGDPTLDTDGLAALVEGLQAAGLRAVEGRLRVWAGALPAARAIDAGQPAHVSYNPAVSGLNLNFNRVHFGWARAGADYEVTLQARTARYRPDVRIARMQVADRRSPVYTYEDRAGRDHWTVARGALGAEGARWLPVRRPALYAGEVFQRLAEVAGLRLPAPEEAATLPAGTATLARRESAPLHEILRDMLEYSTNLTAEVAGLAATAARGARAATLAESGAEMARWSAAALGMETCRFVDHSGLGDASRVTATEMARAMVAAERAGGVRALLEDYDVRDARGRPMRDAPFEVRAKTGTLHFVSALTGYLSVPGGRTLGFAILTGDVAHRETLTRAQLDRPPGARAWAGRSRRLQSALLRRWAQIHSA